MILPPLRPRLCTVKPKPSNRILNPKGGTHKDFHENSKNRLSSTGGTKRGSENKGKDKLTASPRISTRITKCNAIFTISESKLECYKLRIPLDVDPKHETLTPNPHPRKK